MARATIDRAAEVAIFMVGSVIEMEEVRGYESSSTESCMVRHLSSKTVDES